MGRILGPPGLRASEFADLGNGRELVFLAGKTDVQRIVCSPFSDKDWSRVKDQIG